MTRARDEFREAFPACAFVPCSCQAPCSSRARCCSLGVSGPRGSAAEKVREIPAPASDEPAAPEATPEVAVLAGGCFWGVQGVFQHVEGVTNAVSGYAGGETATARYETVGRARPGTPNRSRSPSTRARSATVASCRSISRSPMTRPQLNRQGPDIGTQYRSAIFPTSAEQARVGEGLHRAAQPGAGLRRRNRHQDRARPRFYPAEDYHQDFLTLNPTYPYIVYQRPAEDRGSEASFSRPLSRRAGAGRRGEGNQLSGARSSCARAMLHERFVCPGRTRRIKGHNVACGRG